MSNAYCVETDRFYGELFRPAEDQYPGKALICFSGSDGGMELSAQLASVFCAQGADGACAGLCGERGKNKEGARKARMDSLAETLKFVSQW